MANIVDRVTVRALRHSLDGRVTTVDAAAELIVVAGHRRWVIERALRRVQRAEMERASSVSERAKAALEAALAAMPLEYGPAI